jgi:hypothetical protein
LNKLTTILLLPLALTALAGCPKAETTASTTEGAATETASAVTPATPETPAAPEAPAEPAADTPAALVGQAAPDFTLADFKGNEYSLSELTAAGKIVVIEWFDYECGATKAYHDPVDGKPNTFIETMNTALVGKDDVVWLSIVSSGEGKKGYDPAGNEAYFATSGKQNPVLRDPTGEIGHKYFATQTPTVFVVGKDGKVVYSGAFDAAAGPKEAGQGVNYTLLAVDAARENKAPEVASTKAFG